MWIADGWKDYELLDCGGGEKLERWGDQILVRPDPQAIWESDRKNRGWRTANARYSRSSTGGGHWDKNKLPESWPIAYKNLRFQVKPMNFKHTGLFPEQAAVQPEPATVQEPAPEQAVAAEPQPDSPAEPSFDVYAVKESDVVQMAGDLQRAHIDRSRESGEPFMGERYEQLMEAERHPEEQLAKLQAEVDAARREFHSSKEARDALNHPCPNLLAGAWVFAKAGRDAKDPVSRMMADMTAMMLRMLLQQAMEEQRRREREAAERRLYESRKNMWDAEKRLKSAEKALAHEDEREEQAKRMRLQEREDKAARRAGGRVKYGADADKQYE